MMWLSLNWITRISSTYILICRSCLEFLQSISRVFWQWAMKFPASSLSCLAVVSNSTYAYYTLFVRYNLGLQNPKPRAFCISLMKTTWTFWNSARKSSRLSKSTGRECTFT